MTKRREVSPENKSFGRRLFQARKDRGLTQGQLAHHLDVTDKQISHYELGYSEFPNSKIKLLSRVLKRPIAYFYDAENTFGEDVELTAAFRNMSLEEQGQWRSLILSKTKQAEDEDTTHGGKAM